ncbi:MAG TPA: DUF6141 family protein [Flavisolibacter sp.]|nr:DUF6141 family protein [Flavisolibacter sp.]
MDHSVLFEEIQASGKKSLRDFCNGMALILLLALVFNLISRKGDISWYTGVLGIGLLATIIFARVVYTRLITQVRTDGIYVRFPPFQPSFDRYEWETILDVYTRHFEALQEYGGWGVRHSLSGKAYIVSGNTGVQVVLKNKKRVLIGTQNPDALTQVLEGLKKTRAL